MLPPMLRLLIRPRSMQSSESSERSRKSEPQNRPGCNSRSAHIGLVCDMYEIDVRQFLIKSCFTQSGMRHVLNSVLEGLRFIHDRGCIHCDLKPANIFMRGAIHLRGCFEKEVLTLQQLGDWDAVAPCPHSRTEFQYQIPNSFEVRSSVQPCSLDLKPSSNHAR